MLEVPITCLPLTSLLKNNLTSSTSSNLHLALISSKILIKPLLSIPCISLTHPYLPNRPKGITPLTSLFKNDYCQNFVDTGERPQNFIRDILPEERFTGKVPYL